MVTVNEQNVAQFFLEKLGADKSEDMEKAVVSWMRQESGSHIVRNNPWNIRDLEWNGETFPKVNGFDQFPDLGTGIGGTAFLLTYYTEHPDYRGYAKVVEAAKAGDAIGFLNALASSMWDAGRYGTLTGGPNHLVNVFDSFGAFREVDVEPGPPGEVSVDPAPAPAPEPTPVPEPTPSVPSYTVQSGDTLWAIATQLLGDGRLWPELWQENRDTIPDPRNIHPGQVLKLPTGIKAPPAPEGSYTVKSGDTLYDIAQATYGSGNDWPRIYAANRTVIGGNPNLIHPGQVLVLPKS